MAKYLSNRVRTFDIGVSSITESDIVLNVIGDSTFQGDIRITDDDKLRFGTSSGGILQIYTNGTNSFFKQISGDLKYELADQFIVQKDSGDEPIAVFTADGSVELYYDNSKKFETTTTGVTVTGTVATDGLSLGDDERVKFGIDDDLQIYHDGANSYITENGPGALRLIGSQVAIRKNSEDMAVFNTNADVQLYYDNSKKFETTTTGVTVTGTVAADGLSLGDDDEITFGDGNDLQIYHESTFNNSVIKESGSGNLLFGGKNIDFRDANLGDSYALFRDDSTNTSVELYYNDSKKFETTTTGVTVTGTALATALSTGASGTGINISTNTISGPATLTIDPAAVGDNTGTVVIAGDLQIDGTTTTVNSTTMTVDDKNLELGTGAANDAAADGGGITIVSGDGNKTFNFEATGDNLGSSENLNLASGKEYKINNTSVLSATTLGSGVTGSSLTSVGTLGSLTVSGDVSIADKIVHTGDTDTAIRFPVNDTFTVETAGSERLRVTSDGFVGINETNPRTGLTINEWGTEPVSNTNTYPFPAGNWVTNWVTQTNNSNDYWAGFGGSGYLRSSATVNIALAPNHADINQQAGMYIAGEATSTTTSVFTIGKIVSGSATGTSSSAGTQRATKEELFRITNTGNVGIGTDDPNTLLHLQSNNPILKFTDANQATDNKSWNIAANSVQLLRIQAISDAGTGGGQLFDFYRNGTQVEKFLGRSGSNYWFAVDNNNQRVGIGTENPTELLHLAADSAHRILLKRGGASPSEVSFGNEGNYAVISNNTNGIDFRTGSTPSSSMHIDQNGLVGIGTETPATILEIAGTGSPTLRISDLDGTDQFGQIIANNGNFVIESRNNTSTGRILFRGRDGSGTVEYGRFDSNGDLGIGIADPQERLHVSSVILVTGETPQIRLNSSATDASDNDRSMLGQATAANNFVSTSATGDTVLRGTSTDNLLFGIGTSEKLRITSAGDVGIGITNPEAKLHVSGGDLYVNSLDDSEVDIKLGVHATNSNFGVIKNVRASNSQNYLSFNIHQSGTLYEALQIHYDEGFYIRGNKEYNTTAYTGKSANVFFGDQERTFAEIVAESESTSSALGTLIVKTKGSVGAFPQERLRIASSGQIGLGGANYGTSGQVLTSNGSSSAPTWQNATALVSAADESTDLTCFPLFATDATGTINVKTDASGLTYNAADEILSATTFSGSRLVSTVTTGTAPLTVTSTTLVSNLNAELLDGLDASQFLRSDDDDVTTGQIQITKANSTTTGGGQIYLNGATGNRIDFNTNGVAAPSTSTRSVGTKLTLYPGLTASTVDYALGIDTSTLWYSVPNNSTSIYRWYGGTTSMMSLSGGNLDVLGTITGSRLISDVAQGTAPLTVTSTTLVSNLNADLLDGQQGSFYLNTGTSFGGDVSGTYNAISITNDSHTHEFNNLTGKTAGTGTYSTSGVLEAGRGSGGVALTVNDGFGNANVTFNHRAGTPEQDGKAGRIEVNTDSTTGDATMTFELGDATASTQAGITQILQLSSGTSLFTGSAGLTFNNRPAFNGGTSGSTAPFSVDSTQVVTNLNADLLDGQQGTFYTNASNIDAGTLAIARGGTNGSATPTAGGAAYGTGTAYAFTAAGTSGQVLTSNGASAPTWQNATAAVNAFDESTDTTCFPLFANNATGSIVIKTDASGLIYDSANERLQSTDVAVKGAVRVENSGSTERFEILYNETTDSLDFTYSAS